jgi:hypothetical protein
MSVSPALKIRSLRHWRKDGLQEFTSLIEAYEQEHNIPAIEIAAALAKMARGDEPLLLDKNRREVKNDDSWRDERPARSDRGERPSIVATDLSAKTVVHVANIARALPNLACKPTVSRLAMSMV